MLRKSLLLIVALIIPAAAKAQFNPADSQNLQSLVAEVHQLRHELQTTTVALQRSQILLHRLDLQENAVNRATERRDAAQSKLTEVQDTRKEMAAFVKQGDDQSDSNNNNKTSEDAAARQGVMMMIPQMKARLESLDEDEQQAQIKLTESEEQLRLEQAKLADLESQLDRLDKSLADSR
jgi:chromosome segregation ATPase